MSIIRTTAMICLTLLICVGLFVYYGSIENRYRLIKADSGLYIFDKNSSVTNYCNTTKCRGLSSGMIVPHKNEFLGIPGVPMQPIPHSMAQPAPYPMTPESGYYGAMTYLPVQSNQAYVLQPVPQGMHAAIQQPMPMPHPAPQHPVVMAVAPQPMPVQQAPVPVVTPPPAPPTLAPEPAPTPAPAEVDEDMGFTLPEVAPEVAPDAMGEEAQMGMAPEASQAESQGFDEGLGGEFPEGGLPTDQNAGGFEAADMGEPGAEQGF